MKREEKKKTEERMERSTEKIDVFLALNLTESGLICEVVKFFTTWSKLTAAVHAPIISTNDTAPSWQQV